MNIGVFFDYVPITNRIEFDFFLFLFLVLLSCRFSDLVGFFVPISEILGLGLGLSLEFRVNVLHCVV